MQGQFANRIGHACHGDGQVRIGQCFRRRSAAPVCCVRRAGRASSRLRATPARRSAASPAGPKTRGKWAGGIRPSTTLQSVIVGGSAASITRGPGIRAGRLGTHLQAAVGKLQDRAAARGDRLDVDERCLQSHAVDLGRETARNLAGWKDSRRWTCRPCRTRSGGAVRRRNPRQSCRRRRRPDPTARRSRRASPPRRRARHCSA